MASFVKPRVSPESVAIAMLLDCRYTTQIEGLFGGVVGRDEGRLASERTGSNNVDVTVVRHHTHLEREGAIQL